MMAFLDRRGYWHDLAVTQRVARDAAERAVDPIGRASPHSHLGRADSLLGWYPAAAEHFDRALEDLRAARRPVGQATHTSIWSGFSSGRATTARRCATHTKRSGYPGHG